eukprot:6482393-Amphidinium_carterae.1
MGMPTHNLSMLGEKQKLRAAYCVESTWCAQDIVTKILTPLNLVSVAHQSSVAVPLRTCFGRRL